MVLGSLETRAPVARSTGVWLADPVGWPRCVAGWLAGRWKVEGGRWEVGSLETRAPVARSPGVWLAGYLAGRLAGWLAGWPRCVAGWQVEGGR